MELRSKSSVCNQRLALGCQAVWSACCATLSGHWPHSSRNCVAAMTAGTSLPGIWNLLFFFQVRCVCDHCLPKPSRAPLKDCPMPAHQGWELTALPPGSGLPACGILPFPAAAAALLSPPISRCTLHPPKSAQLPSAGPGPTRCLRGFGAPWAMPS